MIGWGELPDASAAVHRRVDQDEDASHSGHAARMCCRASSMFGVPPVDAFVASEHVGVDRVVCKRVVEHLPAPPRSPGRWVPLQVRWHVMPCRVTGPAESRGMVAIASCSHRLAPSLRIGIDGIRLAEILVAGKCRTGHKVFLRDIGRGTVFRLPGIQTVHEPVDRPPRRAGSRSSATERRCRLAWIRRCARSATAALLQPAHIHTFSLAASTAHKPPSTLRSQRQIRRSRARMEFV